MRLKRNLLALVVLLGALAAPAGAAGPAPSWVDSMPVPDQAITHMSMFPGGETFVYMHNRSSVYVSSDYGLTFEPLAGPPTGSGALEMATPQVGYFAGYSNLFRTDDGSESWQELPPIKMPGRLWNPSRKDFKGWDFSAESIAPRKGTEKYAIGGQITYINRSEREDENTTCYGGRQNAAVFTTDDGGRSGDYRITKLPFPGFVQRLGFLNARQGWALAHDMRPDQKGVCGSSSSRRTVVLITDDGGKTYKEIWSNRFDEDQPRGCTSVAMASRQRILVGCSDGWVYISKNGGDGFEPVQSLVPPGADRTNAFWVSGIEFATAKIGYAIGKGGGAWRTENGGQTWDIEPSSQSVWGIGVGDIAVGDAEHAIGGGPNSIITRVP